MYRQVSTCFTLEGVHSFRFSRLAEVVVRLFTREVFTWLQFTSVSRGVRFVFNSPESALSRC